MGRLLKYVVILVLVGTVYSLPSKPDKLQDSQRAEVWKRLRTLIERIEGPGKRQYSSSYSTWYGSYYSSYSSGYYGSDSYGSTYSSSYGSYYTTYSSGYDSYGSTYSSSYGSHYSSYSSGPYGYSSTYSNSYGSYYPGFSSGYHGSNSYGSSNSGYHGSSDYGDYDNGYGTGGYINDGPISGSGSHQGHTKQFGKEAIKYVLGLLGDFLNEAVDNEYDQHHEHDGNERCREVHGRLPYDEPYMYDDSDGQMQMFDKMGLTLKNLATRINDCSGAEVISIHSVDNLIDMASTAYQLESAPVDPYFGVAELEALYNAEKNYALENYSSVWTPKCHSDITAYDCNMEQLHEQMMKAMHMK